MFYVVSEHSATRLRSWENRSWAESVKAAAGCQMWRGKVRSVEVGFRERSIVSLPSQARRFAFCLIKLAHSAVLSSFHADTRFKKKTFMVLAEDFTMSRTDEVHRLTENVYKVRLN